jgi:hypothetical protein
MNGSRSARALSVAVLALIVALLVGVLVQIVSRFVLPTTGRLSVAVPLWFEETVIFVVLLVVRRFARSISKGDAFTKVNVQRIRLLGVLFLVGGPVERLLRMQFARVTEGSRLVGVAAIFNSLPGEFIWALVVGLTLFVIAEVFAYGLRLREDVESTI